MSYVGAEAAWASIVTDLIYNPEHAIPAYWQQLKDEGTYIGLPVTHEIDDPDTGGKQMAFSSGAVIVWDPANGASLL
jgi:uncharacterized protein with LGFP repeats